jgi:hypothetical protein
MTISRRPNKYPSRENAPGPSKTIPTAVSAITKAASLAPSKANGGAGNQENVIPKTHSPTIKLANGVINPITKATPPPTKVKATVHTARVRSIRPDRYRAPKVVAIPPTAARSSNSPMPGLPPGKVENSLCR